jgi:hypothetical protein
MKLFRATITCKMKSAWLSTTLTDTIFNFTHAIAAEDEAGASQVLQSTFPWTFYKHVKVSWTCIGMK